MCRAAIELLRAGGPRLIRFGAFPYAVASFIAAPLDASKTLRYGLELLLVQYLHGFAKYGAYHVVAAADGPSNFHAGAVSQRADVVAVSVTAPRDCEFD